MKKLVCEMCGSDDLMKQDGAFVCQSCGAKYSTEEAKRMMSEETEQVSGSIQADKSEKIKNLYQLARRSRDEGSREKAAKYYEQILLENPDGWEASFYTTYYSIIQYNVNNKIGAAIKLMDKLLNDVFKLILNETNDENEQISIASEVSSRLSLLCESLYNDSKDIWQIESDRLSRAISNGYKPDSAIKENNDTLNVRMISLSQIYASLGFNLLEIFSDNGDTGKEAKALIDKAIRIADRDTVIGVSNRERKELINSYKTQMAKTIEETAKRRINEYWETHQSEKIAFESEKQTLIQQITTLENEKNNKLISIPEYNDMMNLKAQEQTLTAEKKSLGLFKLKEKKAIGEKIKIINAEIAQISVSIAPAIDTIERPISSRKERIAVIDNELTKPR